MIICRSVEEMRQWLRAQSAYRTGKTRTVGLVPTMGYLHDGHLSLVKRAKRENDYTVLSIFVNPLQFGPTEDFERYPRDEERDLALAEGVGTDAVFLPSLGAMYPDKPLTTVQVAGITEALCGASRPGHFDGVATVVSKLFHIVDPDRAYFGMKDAQQVAVLTQMVNDLNLDTTIVRCPTLREADGLALSSRNVYLTPEERSQATVLYKALQALREALKDRELTVAQAERLLMDTIQQSPLAVIEYAEVRTFPRLEAPARESRMMEWIEHQGTALIAALAVKFGNTRLIDNMVFDHDPE
ncbi:pantoate--beta-alanine ligase [Xylanibacillus composti]|uniref:Pantothenate synthetase n=1 Tax=Xylanibacillus composti TaxID=1572762 RepID=A0A8J4M081_9BACL|nr:pantoate--beta-alanine ligase [Xylanibacillus composti]MDT9725496.1 pantoate--beta-alanine ligase [Xylanibacillus composti]GIQ67590.1 pantoate--beta-alanine ligase [Xylanibacillus composti]